MCFEFEIHCKVGAENRATNALQVINQEVIDDLNYLKLLEKSMNTQKINKIITYNMIL